LIYEVEEPERYFENAFLVDCQHFVISFKYPTNSKMKLPELYEINQEEDTKTQVTLTPTIEDNDDCKIVKWDMQDVSKGQTIRIEW